MQGTSLAALAAIACAVIGCGDLSTRGARGPTERRSGGSMPDLTVRAAGRMGATQFAPPTHPFTNGTARTPAEELREPRDESSSPNRDDRDAGARAGDANAWGVRIMDAGDAGETDAHGAPTLDAGPVDASAPPFDGGSDAGTPDATPPTCIPESEHCNGLDDDCDEHVPYDERDEDEDGVRVCAGDCDDFDSLQYPDAPEMCNGRDENCNGIPDDGCE